MGSGSSAPEAPAAVIQNPADVETSSGFHILEVHAPTAGLGFVTLFIALTCFCCGFGAFSWYKKHHGRRAVLRQAAVRRRRDEWLELGLSQGLARPVPYAGSIIAPPAAVMAPQPAPERFRRYQGPPRRFEEVDDDENEEFHDAQVRRSAVIDNI